MPVLDGRGTSDRGRLAIFVASSGHSGVDRVIGNLARQIDAWNVPLDVLKIRGHGPRLDMHSLQNTRLIDLGSSHVTSSLPALVGYLRRERPAAMLTDKDRVNRTAVLACKLARVSTRLVVRVGTTVSVNLASRGAFERLRQRTSMRWLYPLADCVLVPSAGVADDLTAYVGIDRRHIQVVPSPVVTPELRAKAQEPVDHPWLSRHEVPVVIGVGELGHRKDFETLVRAFARVRKERPCRLIILGRGRRKEALRALTADLGVAKDVDLPGFHPNPYAYMARADLFVLSSLWEGMPVALIEALALHTPVVSTDCPSGPREILAGSSVGTLVPVGEVEAMGNAMGHWLDAETVNAEFEQAVGDYRIETSACAYLKALGIPCPPGLEARWGDSSTPTGKF